MYLNSLCSTFFHLAHPDSFAMSVLEVHAYEPVNIFFRLALIQSWQYIAPFSMISHEWVFFQFSIVFLVGSSRFDSLVFLPLSLSVWLFDSLWLLRSWFITNNNTWSWIRFVSSIQIEDLKKSRLFVSRAYFLFGRHCFIGVDRSSHVARHALRNRCIQPELVARERTRSCEPRNGEQTTQNLRTLWLVFDWNRLI